VSNVCVDWLTNDLEAVFDPELVPDINRGCCSSSVETSLISAERKFWIACKFYTIKQTYLI
jgi:hypothetical protein